VGLVFILIPGRSISSSRALRLALDAVCNDIRTRIEKAVEFLQLRAKDHFIPLKESELAEIDSWSCSDTGPWITNAAGKPMTGNALSFAPEAFLAGAPELSEFRLKPHGLRAMAVCDRRALASRDFRAALHVATYGNAIFEAHRSRTTCA
jgi:hypothetical protein